MHRVKHETDRRHELLVIHGDRDLLAPGADEDLDRFLFDTCKHALELPAELRVGLGAGLIGGTGRDERVQVALEVAGHSFDEQFRWWGDAVEQRRTNTPGVAPHVLESPARPVR